MLLIIGIFTKRHWALYTRMVFLILMHFWWEINLCLSTNGISSCWWHRFTTKSNLTPSFMTEIFTEKNPPYHLANESILQMPMARTVRLEIESIAFLGCKLWHGLSNDITESLNISIFKRCIKESKGDEYNCWLCKTFVAQVECLNWSCFIHIQNSPANMHHM